MSPKLFLSHVIDNDLFITLVLLLCIKTTFSKFYDILILLVLSNTDIIISINYY